MGLWEGTHSAWVFILRVEYTTYFVGMVYSSGSADINSSLAHNTHLVRTEEYYHLLVAALDPRKEYIVLVDFLSA